MGLNHEKLNVYHRALSFNAKVCDWTSRWNDRHAICGQLDRAAGSIIENIALASASFSIMKIRSLDYAIGSALECAACLDLSGLKRLHDYDRVQVEKEDLAHVVRMLIGLRKSWSSPMLAKEDRLGYEAEAKVLFHHEELDVYRAAIEAAAKFSASEAINTLALGWFRRLDELLTSMVLNIAEGNGRFSEVDHQRFLGVAHESAVKLAARLDLGMVRGLIPSSEVDEIKSLLERVSAMLVAMMPEGRRIGESANRQGLRQGSRQSNGDHDTFATVASS